MSDYSMAGAIKVAEVRELFQRRGWTSVVVGTAVVAGRSPRAKLHGFYFETDDGALTIRRVDANGEDAGVIVVPVKLKEDVISALSEAAERAEAGDEAEAGEVVN